ncbi:hypothetical protein Y032_0668g1348 [Ancylostoma ceylanicum]|uniref:Uncharacterized protein n=1 Tax=Ancylostoma ceylanicum TaxID=53326 RepID=A0A016WJN3_9BILA|nr:hypothetical protein Y032_0668g1348 [Ancylostoma ceylanicum]
MKDQPNSSLDDAHTAAILLEEYSGYLKRRVKTMGNFYENEKSFPYRRCAEMHFIRLTEHEADDVMKFIIADLEAVEPLTKSLALERADAVTFFKGKSSSVD